MLTLEEELVHCFLTGLAAPGMRQAYSAVITEELKSLSLTALTVMMLESDAKVW